MTHPYTESDLRKLDNFDDNKYTGEKDNYDINASIDTHRSVAAAVNDSVEQFMQNAKKEMKRLMDQLEKARTEMNEDSTKLLALLKMMPIDTERKEAGGIRKWAEADTPPTNP